MGETDQLPPELGSAVGFALGLLRVPLYDWQQDVLFDLERPGQVALRCPNEAGKTAHIAASAVLWHMSCFPGSITVATSGSWRQVKHQLVPALNRHGGKPAFRQWTFREESITAPNGSKFLAFSTNDPGKFEGFHNMAEIEVEPGVFERPPLFILVDEAKTVDQQIYEAVDRCRPDRLLLMSSPGGSMGEFCNAFGRNRAQYRCHAVGLKDCPHIDRAKIAKLIAKYGEGHPFILSSVHGQFADDPDSGHVVTSTQVEACTRLGLQWLAGERHAFLDFAAGGDENVIALREGNRVTLPACWRETNTMAACGEFIRWFRKLGLQDWMISGDGGGLGRVMLDRLAELGWNINRVDNGGKANEPEAYADRGSEIWGEGARQIESGQIILPNDPDLIAQLTSRQWEDRTSDGKLKLVSKKKMKAAGLPSPDRADGVMGCLQPLPMRQSVQIGSGKAPEGGWLAELEDRAEGGVMAGFDAGF